MLGVLGALPYLVLIRNHRRPAVPAAAGLVAAAGIYLAFAAFAGDPSGLLVEGAGLLVFALVAWVGLRFQPALLAFGWAAHVGWDLFLHSPGAHTYAPAWYPTACLGFDLFVAGFLAACFWPGSPAHHPRISTTGPTA